MGWRKKDGYLSLVILLKQRSVNNESGVWVNQATPFDIVIVSNSLCETVVTEEFCSSIPVATDDTTKRLSSHYSV